MTQNTASAGKVRKKHLDARLWTGDVKAFNIIGYTLLILFAAMCIIPFYLIVIGSFETENILTTKGFSLYVRKFTLEAYKTAIGDGANILRAYGVTAASTVLGTFLSVFICTMTGYALSRKDFPWRNRFSFFFFFTTLFNGGLVPYYLICTQYYGFKNSFFALVLPMAFSVWNMIIAKSFMRGIPDAISESAKIDGANDFIIYVRLIIPLSTPLIATIGLFSALGYWNDWYNCMLFIEKDTFYTLQYYLQRMLNNAEALKRIIELNPSITLENVPSESMKMAMTVIATGPIVLVYPFVQRYFVKGLTIGAVKG